MGYWSLVIKSYGSEKDTTFSEFKEVVLRNPFFGRNENMIIQLFINSLFVSTIKIYTSSQQANQRIHTVIWQYNLVFIHIGRKLPFKPLS